MQLRPWEHADAPCVREGKALDEPEAAAWVDAQRRRVADRAGISLAIADVSSGRALGYIGLLVRPRPGTVPAPHDHGLVFEPQHGTVGIGYWLLVRARGRGRATRAVSLLSRWALDTAGIVRIEALAESENAASRRVLAATGFREEGRLRAYLDLRPDRSRSDAVVYSLLQGDPADGDPGARPHRAVVAKPSRHT